jgi:hypothetical protein
MYLDVESARPIETVSQEFRQGALDAVMLGYRKASATLSKSLVKPPFGSRIWPVGGRRKVLPMREALLATFLLPDEPYI